MKPKTTTMTLGTAMKRADKAAKEQKALTALVVEMEQVARFVPERSRARTPFEVERSEGEDGSVTYRLVVPKEG